MEKDTRSLKRRFRLSPALVGLLWLLVIYLAFAWIVSYSVWISQLRWDITEDRTFSLSDGTRRIVESIDEPIHLRLFFSPELTQRYPALRAYRDRVEKLLNEMRLYSQGRLQVHQLQPQPFSREEDLAFAHGLQPVSSAEPDKALFFGMSGTNSLDGLETLAFLSPEQEPFLEYQVARLIERLIRMRPRQIGILSQLSDDILWNRDDAHGMGVALYPLRREMRSTRLSMPLQEVPPETDLLLLLHPPELDDVSVKAIRNYLASGGKMAVFVDPLLRIPSRLSRFASSTISELSSLLNVVLDSRRIVFDPLRADTRDSLAESRPDNLSAVLRLTIQGDAINRDDILTRDLKRLILIAPGVLTSSAQEGDEMLAMLWHSDQYASQQIEAEQILSLGRQPVSGQTERNLPMAWRVTPRISGSDTQIVPGGVVVVADVDMLQNHSWSRRHQRSGQPVYLALGDNGNFFYNLVDHLSASANLIGIAPRRHADRPFTRIEALRLESEKKFRQTEQRLVQQLRETERMLNQWQQSKSPQDKLILTPEQQRELQRFQQVKLDIREKLRAVRHGFEQDVADLGRLLLLINLFAAPALLMLTGLLFWRWRHRRSRRPAFSSRHREVSV